MTTARWSDDVFLDALRRQVDPLADRTVAALERDHGIEAVNRLFRTLHADDAAIPADAPAPLLDFVAATLTPVTHDPAQLERGGAVFARHAFSSAVVLLLYSLPEGYSAPCLSRILSVSGDLESHPYKRLMGVLQLLVDLSTADAFLPLGAATVSAQKMRLLHAGVRRIVPRYRPDYVAAYGLPVNHEDMLATIMGFSLLVVDGLQILKAPLSSDDAEDFYALWKSFALQMGIHPADRPTDSSYVPETLSAARLFYRAYARRHYVDAATNPDGVALSKINLQMVESLLPTWTRILGARGLPRLVMAELLGEDGMERVGMKPPATGHRLLATLFTDLLRSVQRLAADAPDNLGERLGRWVFRDMIVDSRGGPVRFLVPDSLASLRALA